MNAEGGIPPGMGLDEKLEKQLEDKTGKLRKAIRKDKPDYTELVHQIVAARKDANALMALATDTRPTPPDTPDIPSEVPLAIPEGHTEDEVRDKWKEQLLLRVRSVHEMLTGTGEDSIPKWKEAINVGWRHRKDRSRRAEPTANALREAHVFALLLSGSAQVATIEKGKVLFSDDFSEGTDKWLMCGPAETTITDKGLRRKNKKVMNADTMIWTKDEFEGNFLFEFTFIPNNGGSKPGALFSICGRPVNEDDDLSVSCGETMGAYNHGVHAYHFSMHRGDTGICNGRKVGTGLNLIGSTTPDPARETGKAYRVAIGKWENGVFLIVDGKLMHYYYDGGTFGPPLSGGSAGMRNWGGLDATFDDVRVYRLKQTKSADSS